MTSLARGSDERGQSSIEFALVLPVLLVVLLAVAQVGVVILSQLTVTHAAREVARAAAVDPTTSPEVVADAVMGGSRGDREVQIDRRPSVTADREILIVTVTTEVPQIAVFSWALPTTVSATVATLSEH